MRGWGQILALTLINPRGLSTGQPTAFRSDIIGQTMDESSLTLLIISDWDFLPFTLAVALSPCFES